MIGRKGGLFLETSARCGNSKKISSDFSGDVSYVVKMYVYLLHDILLPL
jgi:hypothetical protein